jgi:peptidoglycan hydrolase CwlO-like protein
MTKTKIRKNVSVSTDVTNEIVVSLVDKMQLVSKSQVTLHDAMRHLLDEVTSLRNDVEEIGNSIDDLHRKVDDQPPPSGY